VVHSHGQLSVNSPFQSTADPFQAAIEVRARVLSLPEDGLAIVGLGKRDIGIDLSLPILTGCTGLNDQLKPIGDLHPIAINDHHLFLESKTGALEAGQICVGDVVSFGISHPCTTIDKWRQLLAVDQDGVVVDLIQTFF